MRIRIQAEGRSFHISLPTGLIFSRFVLRKAFRRIPVREGIPALPPAAADILAAELKRLKKKHGAWTLAEVQSADGEQITVTL